MNVSEIKLRNHRRSQGLWAKWLGVIPLVIALLVLILLTRMSSTPVFKIPNFPGQYFNIVLLGGASFLVAYLAWRGFNVSGQVQLMLFGGGALSLGMATALSAAVFLLSGQINPTSAIYATGVLLSSLLFLMGAITALGGGAKFNSPAHGKRLILVVNAGILVLPILFWALHSAGLLPTFFVLGQGQTQLRAIMVDISMLLFTSSGLAYVWLSRRTQSIFMHWHGLGLLLFTFGLLSWQFAKVNEDAFLWLGRIAQYIGAVYFGVAVGLALKEARARHLPIAETVAAFF